MKRKTNFVEEAKKIHNNKYDYSLTNYVNTKTKVIIICPIHGKFSQTPETHLSGSGCPICGREKASNKNKKTFEQFTKEANKIHNNFYTYTNYINNSKPISIICPIHGEFFQRPKDHLKGQGCPICNGTPKKNIEQFIEEANKIHNFKFDYSKSVYINNHTKLLIICKNCKTEFLQTPNSHLQGNGCPNCRPNKKLTFEDFKQKAKLIHGENYTYTDYVNCRTKIKILCNNCGNYFYQTPAKHLCGRGCPACKSSHGEEKIATVLNKLNITFIPQKTFDDLKVINNLRFDFYLLDKNILIEYNGLQHYKPVRWSKNETEEQILFNLKKQRHYDWLKRKYAKKNNIKLITIPYWEYDNIEEILTEWVVKNIH